MRRATRPRCFRCRWRACSRLRCEVPTVGGGVAAVYVSVCRWHRWWLGDHPPLVVEEVRW